MSDIGKAVKVKLEADSDVLAITSTRIYPGHLKQDATLPAITYRIISDIPENHITGAGELTTARIQLDCYAATYAAAMALKEKVRLAIDGVTGDYGTEEICDCNLEGTHDFQEQPVDGSDSWRYGFSLDFLVSYYRDI